MTAPAILLMVLFILVIWGGLVASVILLSNNDDETSGELGNAPAHKLFDTVHVERVEGVTAPRKYSDYHVWLDDTLPDGVSCERLS